MSNSPGRAQQFETNLGALHAYANREGHAKVPVHHIETHNQRDFRLGAWVSYQRTRHHQNRLTPQRIAALEAVPGWQWGPLKPGPPPQHTRNQAICEARSQGATLNALAKEYGLSRQRIHQIITGSR